MTLDEQTQFNPFERPLTAEEQASRQKMLQIIQDYQDVFDNPKGKNVLQHLYKACFLGETSFVAENPYATAFNEGKRKVALMVRNFINKPLSDWAQQYGIHE